MRTDSFVPIIGIDEDGNPLSCEFYSEYVVAGKIFMDVYAPITINDNDEPYQIFLTKREGLVGFEGFWGTVYALQGLE